MHFLPHSIELKSSNNITHHSRQQQSHLRKHSFQTLNAICMSQYVPLRHNFHEEHDITNTIYEQQFSANFQTWAGYRTYQIHVYNYCTNNLLKKHKDASHYSIHGCQNLNQRNNTIYYPYFHSWPVTQDLANR